ncbi:MAG: carbohydrate kinase family protein [Nitrososphaerota archaeon]|nr:carbohydrate kinase family protein [Nitrososphaerota archaeon]
MESRRARSSTTAGHTRGGRSSPTRTGPTLTFLGAVNWDTTIFEKEFAPPGAEVPVLRIEEGPGGKGANAAVAAAKLLGKGKVAFIGAAGADRFGRALRQSLKDAGVSADGLLTLKGSRTGTAHVVVDGSGSKTIHTHFGANDCLAPGHLDAPAARRALSSSVAVAVMDVPVRTAEAAAGLARDSDARLVYSPGVRCGAGLHALSGVLSAARDAVFDRSELMKLQPSDDPAKSVLSLLRLFPSLTVVATLGPSGSLVGRGGSVVLVPPANLSALGLKPVNSTGSGDAFLAAYVCYSESGMEPEDAAYWGNLAGALKAADPRTRGSPSRQSLEASMAVLRRRRLGSLPNRAS